MPANQFQKDDNMTQMTQLEEALYLLKERGREGFTAAELHEFFPDVKQGSVSAILSKLYSEGDLRRERVGKGFRYFYEEGAKPEAVEHRQKRKTAAAVSHDLDAANEKIAELEAWKAHAIERFPDLAVRDVVIKARKIVADQLREGGDCRGANDVLNGQRDGTAILRATVTALEMRD